MSEEDSDIGPGWAAIDAALERLYGGQEHRHFANPAARFQGDQLVGVSVYRRQEPVPHWHYITYGLTDLFGEQEPGPEGSGFGFELTFRVASDDDVDPPMWPLNMLHSLAQYVGTSGTGLGHGHWMGDRGPITDVAPTKLTSMAFSRDPELASITSPSGSVEFIQAVPLTTDEIRALTAWNTDGLLAAIAPVMPLWVTDLQRDSHLRDPAVAEVVAQGMTQDGSATHLMFLTTLDWEASAPTWRRFLGQEMPRYTVTLTAERIEGVAALLESRLLFGRFVALVSEDKSVFCWPGDLPSVEVEEDRRLKVTIPPEACRALVATLRREPGEYEVEGLPQLLFRLVYRADADPMLRPNR